MMEQSPATKIPRSRPKKTDENPRPTSVSVTLYRWTMNTQIVLQKNQKSHKARAERLVQFSMMV
jgi:hypothetical protein